MKQLKRAALAAAVLLAHSAMAQTCAVTGPGIAYPVTRTVEQSDDYHGVKVADPYRWLEDANSAETHAWVDRRRTR
jgi:prolyl oligopeptidase